MVRAGMGQVRAGLLQGRRRRGTRLPEEASPSPRALPARRREGPPVPSAQG